MIPIACPQFGPEEEAAVIAVMRSGQLAQGPQVRAFEGAFAEAVGSRFGIATSNGSTALYLALLAHGIGPGDEVITSPLTFIASANAVVHAGACPVFVDVDDSLNLSLEAVAGQIGPKTRAIVPVHLHGNPCDLDALDELAERHGLALIQDACQAVGARVGDRPLGSYGTAVYSLYATKNLTTGEGGMVVTNDPEVARTCASLRSQAYSGEPYVHEAIGYNFRMSEIQAAIGLEQLRKLPQITSRRREIAAHYDANIDWSRYSRPSYPARHLHVYHQYTLRLPPDRALTRDRLREELAASGIGSGVYYPVPLHRQPPYRHLQQTQCPAADRAAQDMVSIPVHPAVSDADRNHIVETLNHL
jgi:perosamine synthetase